MSDDNLVVSTGQKYALIIGIENYPKGSGQTKVPFARSDALEMAEYARKAGFKMINDKPLLDDEATNREVINQLNRLFRQAEPEDFVLLYYAGHGYYTEYGGYLIPSDYKKDDEVHEGTCISFDTIGTRFKYKKNKRFLFFLDTCHSGLAVGGLDIRKASRGNPRVREIESRVNEQMKDIIRCNESQQIIGRVIFTSSGPLEESHSIDELKHGLFTYYLLDALKSTDGKEYINVEELIPKVRTGVREYCFRHGTRSFQNPTAFTNIQGEFLIPAYEIKKSKPTPITKDVFISYSSKKSRKKQSDHDIANKICSVLEAANIGCWVAPRDIPPGAKWDDSITMAIERSKIMVLVFSSNTEKSRWVNLELNLAVKKELIIIPFRIENIEPQAGMKLLMTGSQWINAYTAPIDNHLCDLKTSILTYQEQDNKKAGKLDVEKSPRLKTTAIEIDALPVKENIRNDKLNIVNRFLMFLYIAVGASISIPVAKNYFIKGGFLNILGTILFGILTLICLFIATGWSLQKIDYSKKDKKFRYIFSLEVAKIAFTSSLSIVAVINMNASPDAFFSTFSLWFLAAIAINVRAFSKLTDAFKKTNSSNNQ
jgi:hypothetical protein